MNRAELRGRARAAVTGLGRPTGAQTPARLTRWAWAADVILALALALACGLGSLDRQDAGFPDHVGPPRVAAPDGVRVFPEPITGPLVRPLADPAPREEPPFGPVHESPTTEWWQFALAALVALPLATRRRYPLASFWVSVTAAEVYHRSPGFDPTLTFICCVVAAYSAAMYSRYRRLALAGVVVASAVLVADHHANEPGLQPAVVAFLLLAAAALAANAVHNWKRGQEAATRLAVSDERARLARELHDVVSHNVSVMVVQAGAARKVMDTAPELAREALLAVESGGRAAMTELRHVIGLLTVDDDGTDLAPQPGLAQLPALADRVRSTGVAVTLDVSGEPVPLPAGVDLAAYRVVQEGLTNAVKHAAGSRVAVAVRWTPDALLLEITDTGGVTAPVDSGSGRGLAGLRERLDVYGGTLTAGPFGAAGYRVRAAIPIGDA